MLCYYTVIVFDLSYSIRRPGNQDKSTFVRSYDVALICPSTIIKPSVSVKILIAEHMIITLTHRLNYAGSYYYNIISYLLRNSNQNNIPLKEITMKDFLKELDDIEQFLMKRTSRTSKSVIISASPYSKAINENITSIEELNLYRLLNLKEGFVTRNCLMIEINLSYRKNNKGKANIERMLNGDPPIDAETNSVIHLHHMGQKYDAPFVELPKDFHGSIEYNGLLHCNSDNNSWRIDQQKVKAFGHEKREYWKKRVLELTRHER